MVSVIVVSLPSVIGAVVCCVTSVVRLLVLGVVGVVVVCGSTSSVGMVLFMNVGVWVVVVCEELVVSVDKSTSSVETSINSQLSFSFALFQN